VKRAALCLLLFSGCCTPVPTDRLDLPREGWPVGKMKRRDGETACRCKIQLELDRLKIEHALLQQLGRNSSPPF